MKYIIYSVFVLSMFSCALKTNKSEDFKEKLKGNVGICTELEDYTILKESFNKEFQEALKKYPINTTISDNCPDDLNSNNLSYCILNKQVGSYVMDGTNFGIFEISIYDYSTKKNVWKTAYLKNIRTKKADGKVSKIIKLMVKDGIL